MVDRNEERIRQSQLDELEEAVRLEVAKAAKTKNALQVLLASEGWELYKKLIEEQLTALEIILREPAGNIDGMLKKEHSSGVVYGLRSALDIPEQELETAEQTLAIELEKQREEETLNREFEDATFGDEEEEEESK